MRQQVFTYRGTQQLQKDKKTKETTRKEVLNCIEVLSSSKKTKRQKYKYKKKDKGKKTKETIRQKVLTYIEVLRSSIWTGVAVRPAMKIYEHSETCFGALRRRK